MPALLAAIAIGGNSYWRQKLLAAKAIGGKSYWRQKLLAHGGDVEAGNGVASRFEEREGRQRPCRHRKLLRHEDIFGGNRARGHLQRHSHVSIACYLPSIFVGITWQHTLT